MDSPSVPNASAQPLFPRWVLPAVLGLALAAYLIFLATHVGAYAGGSDSSGYLNNARLIAQGRTHTPLRPVPGIDPSAYSSFLFVPLGFRPMSPTTMAPTYPIGLPLSVISTAQITGWAAAPHVTMLFYALAGVVLTAVLARQAGLPWSWAWFGGFVLGLCPVYLFMALQFMSDVPATTAAIAAVVCAWRSREFARWAAAAGFAFALAVLIRPSNALMIFPLALCLGGNFRAWVWFGLGGLPGAAAQALYNFHAYGKVLESGYGGLERMFSSEFLSASLANYALWLPVLLSPVGLLVLGLPWAMRQNPRLGWVLVVWIVAMFGFYATYRHTQETWWYLRFILPAFPACVVGGLWVAHTWWRRTSASLRTAQLLGAVACFALVAHMTFWSYRLRAASAGRNESIYPEVIAWEKAHFPANAVVATMQASGALAYYGDFLFFRWDMLQRDQFAQLAAACAQNQRPIYAALWPSEIDSGDKRAFDDFIPGKWTKLGNVRDVTFWKLEAATVPAAK